MTFGQGGIRVNFLINYSWSWDLNYPLRQQDAAEKNSVDLLKQIASHEMCIRDRLSAAHDLLDDGVDVIMGYVEPHARPETAALMQGLEQLPLQEIAYKNVILHELDLDGAIARHPQVILVDELAHTNALGCRHTKRYICLLYTSRCV